MNNNMGVGMSVKLEGDKINIIEELGDRYDEILSHCVDPNWRYFEDNRILMRLEFFILSYSNFTFHNGIITKKNWFSFIKEKAEEHLSNSFIEFKEFIEIEKSIENVIKPFSNDLVANPGFKEAKLPLFKYPPPPPPPRKLNG